MAVVEGFGEDFAEGVQFRGVGERGGAGVWRIGFGRKIRARNRLPVGSACDQAGVAADLAEAEELGEGGELQFRFAGTAGFEVEEFAFGSFLGVAVEFGLRGRQLAPDGLLDFFGSSGATARLVRRRM